MAELIPEAVVDLLYELYYPDGASQHELSTFTSFVNRFHSWGSERIPAAIADYCQVYKKEPESFIEWFEKDWMYLRDIRELMSKNMPQEFNVKALLFSLMDNFNGHYPNRMKRAWDKLSKSSNGEIVMIYVELEAKKAYRDLLIEQANNR